MKEEDLTPASLKPQSRQGKNHANGQSCSQNRSTPLPSTRLTSQLCAFASLREAELNLPSEENA